MYVLISKIILSLKLKTILKKLLFIIKFNQNKLVRPTLINYVKNH